MSVEDVAPKARESRGARVHGALNDKSAHAVTWSAAGTAARYLLQLLAQIILARLLGPANYGLFALALLVLMFSSFLADLGLCWGLVQAKELSENDIRFAATWQILSATLVATILFLAAPYVAVYFSAPDLEPVVRWLSLSCMISAASTPATNLLIRNLDFRTLNLMQVGSYAIGYVIVGIPMAYAGHGVWALVGAWIVQASCVLVIAFYKSPYPVKPLFWYSGAGAMSRIGATVFATNICNWLLNNFDRIFLGRFLDVHSVGLYTAGYNLANTPNALLIGAMQPAFLAAGARVQDEPDRLRRAYLSVIGVIWTILLPLFVILALLAHDLVLLLYGPDWQTTGMILAILALAMPAYITWGLSTPILWNTGRRHWECLLQAPIVVFAGIALFWYASAGIVAVAMIAASVLLLRAIVVATAACSRLHIGIRELGGSAGRALIMVVLVALGTSGGRLLAAMVDDHFFVRIMCGALTGAATLAAVVICKPSLLGPAVGDMFMRFASAFPRAGVIVRAVAGKG